MNTNGLLFVSNFLSASGFNRSYAEDLSERLEQRGWSVVRTSHRAERLLRLGDMLRTAWARRATYAVAQVDVFSGPAFVWAEAVCFELRRLGKPYVLTLHGGNLPEFARQWPRRVRALLGSAVEVTAPSDYLREQLRAYREDIVLRRNAIDVAAIPFTARTVARPRLLWVRAFHDIYNPVLAIDVVAKLRTRFPDVRLRMLGPDKLDGSLGAVQARILELGLTDAVDMVGRVPKHVVAEELAAADIFLNTANIDNTPLSLLEAMAAGLCVVTTSVGGIPYLVNDASAVLVPPSDASAMTAAVERLLADRSCVTDLSRQAHALAAAHDWPVVLDEWEHAFRRMGAAA
jgi:glycosyltransferase involved in cell wall biosynthesis